MAKITRKTAVIFGSSAATNQIAQFGSLNAGSPQLYSGSTADPATIQNLANWQTGWFAAVEDVNSPAIEDMNAVHFVNSYQIGYALQQGVPEWDAGTTYYTNSMVSSGGLIYVSIADTNLNHVVSNTSWWIPGFLSLGAANSAQTQTLNGRQWLFEGPSSGSDAVNIQLLGQSASQGATGFDMRTASAAAVNCFHTVGKTSGQIWAFGFKNSDNSFRVSASGTLGTSDCINVNPTTTNVSITRTNTNDNQTAGTLGEAVRSAIASGSAITISSSGTWQNVTSIALTAGDWDITGILEFSLNGATCTNVNIYLSQFTGNTSTDIAVGDNSIDGLPPTSTTNIGLTLPAWRVSVATSTTVFLKALGTFSAGNPKAFGRISARRA